MATSTKNQAVIDFICTYPYVQDSPLFFNFINAKTDNIQFLTSSNDVSLNKQFVDGSVLRRYTFTLAITKSMSDLAIVKEAGISNENVEDIEEIQTFMDWINDQDEARNYPDFGSDCVIDEMHTLTENPNLDGINTEVTPALAMYSVQIKIDYIDYTKILWSKKGD